MKKTDKFSSHTFEFCKTARARHINCIYPLDKSEAVARKPPFCFIADLAPHFSRALHSSTSEYCSNGSKLSRILPLNMKGSCGITDNLDLREHKF